MAAFGRVARIVGGSLASLYLVCVLLAVSAVGTKPVIASEQAASSSSVSVVAENAQSDSEKDDASIVEETAEVIPPWLEILTAVMALAGVITAVTPTPKDNAVLIVVRKFFDILALNVGGAKNAASEKQKKTDFY